MQQQQHHFLDEHSLASAFSNLNFGSRQPQQNNGFEVESYPDLESSYGGVHSMGPRTPVLKPPQQQQSDYLSSNSTRMYIDSNDFSSPVPVQSTTQAYGNAPGAPYGYPASWMLSGNDSGGDQVDVDMVALYEQRVQAALQQRLAQQQMEERMRQRQQQRFLQSQIEAGLYALQGQPGGYLGSGGLYSRGQSYGRQGVGNPLTIQKQIQQLDVLRNQAAAAIASGNLDGSGYFPGVCRFYAQGFCSQGDSCTFLHYHPSRAYHSKDSLASVLVSPQDRYLSRKNYKGLSSFGMPRKKLQDEELQSNEKLSVSTESTDGECDLRGIYEPQQPKYTSLDEIAGQMYAVAKDQQGCRFLQKTIDEGNLEDIKKIFEEVIGHIVDLMTDPFGNYLVQKLLEVSNDTQRKEILRVVTRKGELVDISLNIHGTRAVQKLIDTLKSPEQVSMVTNSLKQGVLTLMKDLNGNHVVQKCLQKLTSEDIQFIIDAAVRHCVEIATHRHGCCVLQRCVDFGSGAQRHSLVSEIAANALVLSQDQYGNYVVQYVLELGLPWATLEVMIRLEGNFALLAMQKFSSNVVEKCLKLSGDESRACIIREIITSSLLIQMLQDPFANYVIQSALSVAKGSLHAAIVDAIRPHVPILHSSPYGKRILSRANIKK